MRPASIALIERWAEQAGLYCLVEAAASGSLYIEIAEAEAYRYQGAVLSLPHGRTLRARLSDHAAELSPYHWAPRGDGIDIDAVCRATDAGAEHADVIGVRALLAAIKRRTADFRHTTPPPPCAHEEWALEKVGAVGDVVAARCRECRTLFEVPATLTGGLARERVWPYSTFWTSATEQAAAAVMSSSAAGADRRRPRKGAGQQ